MCSQPYLNQASFRAHDAERHHDYRNWTERQAVSLITHLSALCLVSQLLLCANESDSGMCRVSVDAQIDSDDYEFTKSEEALCQEWCGHYGFCDAGSNAREEGCWAHAIPAAVRFREERCVRWCDDSAVLLLNTKRHFMSGEELTVVVRYLNPPATQNPARVHISAAGPKFFVPTTAAPMVGSGVLAASVPPMFEVFTVGDSECVEDEIDAGSSKWFGSCIGQYNTITVTIQPNLDLATGSNITLTGLVRTQASHALAQPSLKYGNGLFTGLRVVSWDSQSPGTLVLAVSSDFEDSNVIPAGQNTVFTLEIEMPIYVDVPGAVRPAVQISAAKNHNEGFQCFLKMQNDSEAEILSAAEFPTASFVYRKLRPGICNPGKCTEIEVSFAVNRVMMAGDYIVITGFHGMERSEQCYDIGCGIDDSSLPLISIVNQTDDRIRFISNSSRIGEATWEPTTQSVKFMVAPGALIDPYRIYSFSFRLRNLYEYTENTQNLFISAFVGESGDCLHTVGGSCMGEMMETSNPFEVCQPGFSTSEIWQQSSFPGCGSSEQYYPPTELPRAFVEQELLEARDMCNQLFLRLTPNVDIEPPANITISNLQGLQNIFDPADYSNLMNWSWDASKQQLVGTLDQLFECDQTLEMAVWVTNPREAQESPDIVITVAERKFIFSASMTTVDDARRILPGYRENIEGSSILALQVDPPRFVIKKIVQSTPYPTATNEIVVTLRANVELASGAEITIDGLVGSISDDNDALPIVHNFSDQGRLSSTGRWSRDTGSLVISVLETFPACLACSVMSLNSSDGILSAPSNASFECTNDIVFSFTLTNPPGCHQSPEVIVSASCPEFTVIENCSTVNITELRQNCSNTTAWNASSWDVSNINNTNCSFYNFTFEYTLCEYTSTGCDCPVPIEPEPMDREEDPDGPDQCYTCGRGDLETHCVACQSCGHECETSDFFPLQVHAPAWTIKTIRQDNSNPGAANRFFVTLAANVAIQHGQRIVLSGFAGATIPANSSFNFNPPSDFPGGELEWDDGAVIIDLNGTYDDLHGFDTPGVLSFDFQLQNPLFPQRAALISVSIQDFVASAEAPRQVYKDGVSDSLCQPLLPTCVMDVTESIQTRPMTVAAPSFTSRGIVQSVRTSFRTDFSCF